MAKHIWDQVRVCHDGKLYSWFQTSTLFTAAKALDIAGGKLHNPVAVYTWIGYAVERVRQQGDGENRSNLRGMWDGACRTGHRYAFGKNADNYERAGHALVQQLEQWWLDWQKQNDEGHALARLLQFLQPNGLHGIMRT